MGWGYTVSLRSEHTAILLIEEEEGRQLSNFGGEKCCGDCERRNFVRVLIKKKRLHLISKINSAYTTGAPRGKRRFIYLYIITISSEMDRRS
jgi:hypothetical protein